MLIKKTTFYLNSVNSIFIILLMRKFLVLFYVLKITALPINPNCLDLDVKYFPDGWTTVSFILSLKNELVNSLRFYGLFLSFIFMVFQSILLLFYTSCFSRCDFYWDCYIKICRIKSVYGKRRMKAITTVRRTTTPLIWIQFTFYFWKRNYHTSIFKSR